MPSRLWVQQRVVPACLGPAMGRGDMCKGSRPPGGCLAPSAGPAEIVSPWGRGGGGGAREETMAVRRQRPGARWGQDSQPHFMLPPGRC